jgi:hypothetical protein
MSASCICEPCTTPAYGHPSFDHCAACCYGTLIATYHPDCPQLEHRLWAAIQHADTARARDEAWTAYFTWQKEAEELFEAERGEMLG